jgi:esterase
MRILEKINHQFTGQGPRKIVFLHGLIGSGNNWSRTIRLFDPTEFTVLTYDQRGHGRSFQPVTGYSAAEYTTDLLEITQELNWPNFDLVGHSMGGRVALEFASLHPQKLRTLTIEDIGVAASPGNTSRIESLITRVPTPFLDRKSAKSYFFGPFIESLNGAKDAQDLANFFYANLVEKESPTDGIKSVDWRFYKQGIIDTLHDGRSKDRSEAWSKIQQPTLLIRGQNSKDLPESEYQRMLELNPKCKGVVIPDSGHWVHFDQPQAFYEQLYSFLKVH